MVVVLLAVASTAGVATVGLLLAGAVGAPARVRDPVLGRLPYVFGGVFLGWLVVAGGLHAATAIFDGEGSFRATLAVAGWGLAPQFLPLVVGVAAVVLAVPNVEFASDPAVLHRQTYRFVDAFDRALATAAGIVAVLWQVPIWTAGLQRARRLRRDDALLAAGLVGALSLVFVFGG